LRVVVALVVGLFGCCCIFAAVVLVSGKMDSDDADYEWNANSGDVNSCVAVVGDVVVAAVGVCYECNKMKKQMKDYLKS
jgi:hypothetical protein